MIEHLHGSEICRGVSNTEKLNILGEQENILRNVCSSILCLRRFDFYQSQMDLLSEQILLFLCSKVI